MNTRSYGEHGRVCHFGIGATAAVIAVVALWGAASRQNQPSPDEPGSVLEALKEHKPAALNRLLSARRSLDDVDDETGCTPLASAVLVEDAGAARDLLTRGANVDAPSLHRGTPLMIALSRDSLELARLLLRAGADINREVDGRNGFAAALLSDDVRCVRLAIDAGADPMPATAWENPLCVGGGYDDGLDVLEVVLSLGVDPNRPGCNGVLPAVYEAASHSPTMCRRLLAAGADPNRRDASGRSASSIFAARHVQPDAPRATPPTPRGAAAVAAVWARSS